MKIIDNEDGTSTIHMSLPHSVRRGLPPAGARAIYGLPSHSPGYLGALNQHEDLATELEMHDLMG